MTLITYPTRVHFADGVLEEALRSEMEAHNLTRPLILCEAEDAESEFSERIRAGLPRRAQVSDLVISPTASKYDTARSAEVETRGPKRPDVIIAFGSARAIAHARKCRHVLHRSARTEGSSAPAADIFAIPGIDGLPSPCRSSLEPTQTLLDAASRSGLPKIVICDPTVPGNTLHEAALYSAADAFARCLESYLSDAYNPPADGMALDGFARAVRSLKSQTYADTQQARRELMAAHLNATFAQQKGIGPTQLIADILREPLGNRVSSGALARVLLPGVLGCRKVSGERSAQLSQILTLENERSLAGAVDKFLGSLPLADRLSDLGLSREDVANASEEIEGPLSSAIHTSARGARAIMEAAY